MVEATKHTGGCHCGKVKFEATVSLEKVMECNCSICSKKATLLAFTPRDQFKLLSGEDNLTEYLFNKHRIHHTFCKTCGVQSFANGKGSDGKEFAAINARCVDGLDLSQVTITQFDGKSI